MRPVRSLSLFLVPFLFSSANAFAQTEEPPRFEDQVVVTPPRGESTIARVPAFVTLIDTPAIEQSSAQDIPDLLRQAGLHVADITGNGRSYRVDLRGFGATATSNTLVLVDGRRVNQPDLSGADWAQIPLGRVERIEIARGGAAAVAYGDNATNGVINIITKAGGARDTRAALKVGSYSTVEPELRSQGTHGMASYAVSAGYRRSDGHRENSQTEGTAFGGQLVLRQDRFALGISSTFHGDKTGLPGALGESALARGVSRDDTLTPDDYADVDDGYLMVTPRWSFGSRGAYALADISIRQRNSQFFSSFTGGTFTGDTGIRTVAVSPKVAFERAQGAMTHRFVAGADVSNASEGITNTVLFAGVPDVGHFTLEKAGRAIYLRDEASAGRASVSGGYRYDSAKHTFTPSTPRERILHSHAADLGATFAVNTQASVYAGISRSFRYPVLDELFDFFGNTIVSSLEPQRSIDVEGGLRVQHGAVRGSVNVFHLTTDDEILYNPTGGTGFGANENLDGTSRRVGVELAASTRVQLVDLGGTVTLLKATIDGGQFDGRDMPSVAPGRVTANVRVPLPRHLLAGLEASYVSARWFEGDFANRFRKQDAYFLLDARVSHTHDRLRLFVDLKNLLNAEYEEYGVLGGFPTEPSLYPSPGFHALVGVEVKLR